MTTRNVVAWIVIAGSVAAYLATMPAPTAWTWAQWMQTVAALAAIVAAKLAPSYLDK